MEITPFAIGVIGLVILIILLFSRMPVGVVMAFIGMAGFAYLQGLENGLGLLKLVPYRTWASYDLSVIPLFILMGTISYYAGISRDLYNAAYKWLGHLPGGLGMATVGACAVFSAVSGSSIACAATFGKVALSEMKRFKYSPALAAGCVAAGGTLDIMIPPSVMMIVYAILTQQSIGKLFLAGFIPGALETILYMITIYILCKRDPNVGPRGPSTTFKEKIVSLKGVWMSLLLFVLVIGGLYFGIFTPTEAGGIGAFGAFVFGLAQRRLSWKSFKESLNDAGITTAMIFVILLGAMIFNYFLAVTRLPFQLATLLAGLEINRYFILVAILIFYVILGAIMDEMAMVLLTVPIFFPVILRLGFDPIWFGVIIIMMCVLGMIAPPVGMIVYIIAGIAPDIPMSTIYRGALPFFISAIILVIILVAFPQIVLFLPNLMK